MPIHDLAACVPQCAILPQHDSPPCLAFLDASGRKCLGSVSYHCEGIASCEDTACALSWLSASELAAALRAPPQWLLFVGDSDTRGIVLSLLQVLATAATNTHDAAAAARGLWLGAAANASDDFAAKICHIDALYDESGRVLGDVRVLPCHSPTRGGRDEISGTNLSYALFGEDYSLRSARRGRAALRVTFVTTLDEGNLVRSLAPLAASLDANADAVAGSGRPTLLYVNAGAWGQSGVPTERRVTPARLMEALSTFAERHVAPSAALVWGTVAAHRASYAKRLDDELLPHLPRRGWHVLSRSHTVGRRASFAGLAGVRLSSRHAPPLVNLIDAQRLVLHLLASRAASRAIIGVPPLATDSGERSCVHRQRGMLSFAAECVGFGAARQDVRFLEALMHFCRWDSVRRLGPTP